MRKVSVLLASGGLDSTTLAYWMMAKRVQFYPLFVNYGQHCATTELNTLRQVLPKRILRKLEIVDVAAIYAGSQSRLIRETNLWEESITKEDLYLPYRNILLLSIAAARVQSAGGGTVYTAFINSNHAEEIDCSARFFGRLSELLKSFGGVRVKMPFRYKSKAQVARIGIRLGAPIGETFSCQVNSRVPCGACPNCVDRLQGLAALGG
ncbi:7-cyano-7-deazaguanine synthase [Lacunisphaera limnophila]|uniref:7-cyano-7-deazaguanine synthase n=1 Tax=Lacunisphaera limnophila TaxID=1838286 RepID=A0A1D8AZW1_9BACT|nr:7-cyano-7-deazaguanine synthase [Lacunisphaera limnophila]AOS46423.1 7-cyano-7-deazaguanine synthase [Lacunisphaera limnophila]